MTIPEDLIVDIRDGCLFLSSGARTVELLITGRHGVFDNGPVTIARIMTYLLPALAQLTEPQR